MPQASTVKLQRLPEAGPEGFYHTEEVTRGLFRPEGTQRSLPPKLFYDERGSALFDRICELDEYYPTRTEIEIMRVNIEEICSVMGPDTLLVELGSGSSLKIRLLLEHMNHLAAYVPVDISEEHMLKSAEALSADYPWLHIHPVCADYTDHFDVPELDVEWSHRVVYYPGSTIGNMTPIQAAAFLHRIADIAGPRGGLLIGVDLKKDRGVLEAAYNDASGITAEFNLNMLRRLNREAGTDFDLAAWRHKAFYNEEHGRIEMHLESKREQVVSLDGREARFAKGETILTEYSYKYSIEGFQELVSPSFSVETVWTDPRGWFSLQYLPVNP